MLQSISLENFKSYRAEQNLALGPLNLLIGANAAGKSNIIEALRLIKWFISGVDLDSIQNKLEESDKWFRGDFHDLTYMCEPIPMTLKMNFANKVQYSFSIEISDNESISLVNEKLTVGKKIIYETIENKDESKKGLLKVKIKPNTPKGSPLRSFNFHPKNKMAILPNINNILNLITENFGNDEKGEFSVDEQVLLIDQCLEDLKSIQFFDFVPSSMRSFSRVTPSLNFNGSNLSGVLKSLDTEGKIARVLDFIKNLPEQKFVGISFFEDNRERFSVELEESFGDENSSKKWSIELLSDGTVRVLAIAAALMTAKPGSLLVFEELDNGIHPNKAKILLNQIYNYAKDNKIKLLITTHNPALMDGIPNEALEYVSFVYRDKEKGHSCLTRLSELDDYVGLVSQGPLGDLVTKGIVDRFVKNPLSNQDKRNIALSWLESMKGKHRE
jgi:AAA15 family ATPase/GTPase